MKKSLFLKKAAVSVLGVAVVGFGSLIYAGNYLYNFALNSKNKKGLLSPESRKGEDDQDADSLPAARQRECLSWVKEWGKDVFVISEDHLILHGHMIKAERESKRYAIICHGYKSRGWNMGAEAMEFHKRGWNVLLPDARGHGESDGTYVGMGWSGRRDVLCWAERILKDEPDAQILLFGLSMGAATVMMAAGEKLPEQIKAVVEDCGYTSVWDEFAYQLKKIFHLPPFPVLYAASWIARIRAGYDIREASAVKQLKKSRLPILFIHGEKDTFVPFAMLEELYEAAAGPKAKLTVPKAEHGLSSATAPKEYWETVDMFLKQYIEEEER